jgi:hypothetical protein
MQSTFEEDDSALDTALATYGASEPLSGLDQRILNRLSMSRSGRPDSRSFVSIAASALGCICVLVILLLQKDNVQKTAPVAKPARMPAVAQIRPTVEVNAPPVARRIIQQTRKSTAHAARGDRDAIFKAPTAEERALLHFVDQHPEDAKVIFASFAEKAAPLEIQPLEIRPLESDN